MSKTRSTHAFPGRTVVCILLAVLLAGCISIHRRLSYHETYSRSVVDNMNYGVYTPPGWDGKTPLPLVVFLHGGGDDELCFDRHKASEILDLWISKGLLPPFLMLVPNGDMSFWVNWYDGTRRYRDYVMFELIPKIRNDYPVLPGSENLHIMGVSMGGFGAMHIAMNHYDEFASVSALSGLLFDPDQSVDFIKRWRKLGIERIFGPTTDRARIEQDNIYTWLSKPDARGQLKILFGPASEDRADVIDSNRRLHDHLKAQNVSHAFVTFEGKHNWSTWGRLYPVVLAYQLTGRHIKVEELPPHHRIMFDLGMF